MNVTPVFSSRCQRDPRRPFPSCMGRRPLSPDEWPDFVRATRRRLWGFLHQAVSPDIPDMDADDLLQELYLRLWTSAAPLKGYDVWPYLYEAARNLVADLRRTARAKKRRGRSHAMAPRVLDPEELYLLRESIALFLSSCRPGRDTRRARDVQSRILELAYFSGYTSREIVRLVPGCRSPGQVDAMVHQLRCRLARRGVRLGRRKPSAPTLRGGRRRSVPGGPCRNAGKLFVEKR